VEALRQFLWENVLPIEFPVKGADDSGMLGRDSPEFLKKGKGSIKHPIVGAMHDALWAPLMIKKNTGVVQCLSCLLQAMLYQNLNVLGFHKRVFRPFALLLPAMTTAQAPFPTPLGNRQ
jgi:hypothetical protein